ncbi:MAG: hypothetical protein M3438_01995 [Pseudomonadota bacterium]|nr:hypothetical protein [Sphingomonas sp.]MDQ3477925.1 hypothetical protein [Pseudomonadota bacterium]
MSVRAGPDQQRENGEKHLFFKQVEASASTSAPPSGGRRCKWDLEDRLEAAGNDQKADQREETQNVENDFHVVRNSRLLIKPAQQP